MSERTFNVLFLCTHNSARSVIAECIMNELGNGRFMGFSAGSQPSGRVNPHAIAMLSQLGYDVSNLRSKSWDEYAAPGATQMDFIFTVCDNAAGEVCPVWPGKPMTAHWGVPDPAAVTGSDAEIAAAFAETYRLMNNRISAFVNLPLASIDRLSLTNRLKEIHQEADA